MLIKGRAFLFLLSIHFLLTQCSDALGKTIHIDRESPADFNNIQSGIDAAGDGDTVLVASGEYVITEPITFRGKAITVRSEVGPDETTIRMMTPVVPERGTVVVFENGETVKSVLQGFTITGGKGSWSLSAGNWGGGGIIFDASSGTVRNCAVVENTAKNGGGVMVYSGSSTTLTNCIIRGNSATGITFGVDGYGGGLFCGPSSSLALTKCTITGNSAVRGGGGVHCWQNLSLVLTHCAVTNNTVQYAGGGMLCDSGFAILTHCVIARNTRASWGGGIMCAFPEASITISNCTICGNSATEGGGIGCFYGGSAKVTNSIIWGNTASKGNEIYLEQAPTEFNITYSSVDGGQAAALVGGGTLNWGEGNIDADPRFARLDYLDDKGTRDDSDDVWVDGDYHLKSEEGRWNSNSVCWVMDDVTSSCVDTGGPNSPVAFETFPNGGIVNMGAYGGTAEASRSLSGLHAKYGGGTGEPNNPYLIYTPEQMNTIGIHTGDWDKHFRLMADIDLSAFTGTDFNIIGCRVEIEDKSFNGVFNGNGHMISNFTYISTGIRRVSLFGYVEGQTVEIRDLGLINPNVSDTKGNYVGSLIGYLGIGSVRRCYVQGGSVSGGTSVGGLVAYNHKGTLVDCSSMVHVIGIKSVGGLVGDNSGEIIGCHTIGTVMGEDDAGGLAGFNDGTIRESSSTGDVIGEKNIGGLVGYSRFGTIQNSYSTGSVRGIQSVGGLVGRSRGDIMNCYAGGSVAGGQYVGGLVGFLGGPIVDCYSTGHLIHEPIEDFGGNLRIGGLVGSGHTPDDILTSFWDMETSGQMISFGGIGKTSTEMQTVDTFLEAGWDFVGETDNGADDIWWMTEGRDYPRFWWELTNEN